MIGNFDNSSIYQLSSIISCCDTRWEVPEDSQLCGQELIEGTLIPCRETLSFWTWDSQTGININIVILAVNVLIFWTVLIFTELNITKLLWIKMKEVVYGSKVAMPSNIDSDVKQEKDTVFQTRNAMTVCNLSKKFGNFDAVRGLTFGVRDKECFGLLGVNGAGKTTTFRMLTGDEIMSSGEAFIGNESLSRDRASYLQSIGYCPQFDSIIEVLTGREMLTLFARIRGLRSSENRITTELEKLASFVDLTQYLDRPCGQYSGGNKRKLNVALALIGRPKVMLLDEPTTGVDPAARRKMWETINAIRRSGTSIILTSHSMEECEALCDRLAIMVQGSFQCLGGPQHIKSKFGKGFQIIIKLEPMSEAVNGIGNEHQNQATKSVQNKGDALKLLRDSVVKAFDSCSVTDEHMDYVHFHVANPETSWSHLFGTMELIKKENNIVQDYSVSETTLEQIFLGFARSEETTEI
jgi:ATP-binding cassette subfamily A (ABC1) protein 3